MVWQVLAGPGRLGLGVFDTRSLRACMSHTAAFSVQAIRAMKDHIQMKNKPHQRKRKN